MKTLKLIIISLLVVFSFNSCKKNCCQDPTNPDCENYDPCYGKKRINSLFKVRPGDNGFKPPEEWCDLLSCDTFNASSVRFDLPVNNPSNSQYEWQIGTEPTPRKSNKGFEVDFSDYLNAGNWETHIPITLTIRTPHNSCMTNIEDTFIKVTRELFFTKKSYHPFGGSINEKVFEGFLLEKPNEIFKVKLSSDGKDYYKEIKTYGIHAYFVGFPFADTILKPWSILVKDQCGNFKHWREITVSDQNPSLFQIFNEYSHGLMQQDYYYLGDNNYLMRLEFHNKGKITVHHFRCKKIQ